MGASIDKYNKEVQRIKTEETLRWTKRFKEANRSLETLKEEISERNLSAALELYLQKMNADLEISKLLVKTAHVNKINSIYHMEMENWFRIVLKASEIIQENFLLYRGEFDSEMLGKLQALGKLLQGQRNVKFAEDEQAASLSALPQSNSGMESTTLNYMNLTDCAGEGYEDATPSPGFKKKRNIDGDTEDELKKDSKKAATGEHPFLRPKAMKSINFDQANALPHTANTKLVGEMTSDMNVTFDLNAASQSKTLNERSNREPSTSSSSSSIAKSK